MIDLDCKDCRVDSVGDWNQQLRKSGNLFRTEEYLEEANNKIECLKYLIDAYGKDPIKRYRTIMVARLNQLDGVKQ